MLEILDDMDCRCDEAERRTHTVVPEIEALADLDLTPEPDHPDSDVPTGEVVHEEPDDFSDVTDMGVEL